MLINIGRRAALVLGRKGKAEAALRRLWIVTQARASPRKRIDEYARPSAPSCLTQTLTAGTQNGRGSGPARPRSEGPSAGTARTKSPETGTWPGEKGLKNPRERD